MQLRNFKDVHQIINGYMPKLGEVNWFFALEDMKELLEQLGNPQDKYPIIHIAGTSGKTSTSYYIAKMLQLSGNKVGLTVSPHIMEVNERLQIDGQPLAEKEFCELFAEFMSILPKTKNKPTYFGLLVSFAYWAFAKLGVDYAVIEVGMGGRLDATNVINSPAKVCVITDIGLDHTQFLGDTISKIAGEKAGIIQSHNPVFMHRQPDDVMEVMTQKAGQEHAQLHVLQNNSSLVPKQMPQFQQRNWSLAKAVVEYVIERDDLTPLDEKSWLASTETVVPARMETFVVGSKTIILDGSHNAQKIGALVEAIKEQYKNKKVSTLVSFVEGKDTTVEDCLKVLHTISDQLITTSFTSTQDLHRLAISPEIIAQNAKKVGFHSVEVIGKAEEALQKLLLSDAEVVVITGSFFLTHELRQSIQKRAK